MKLEEIRVGNWVTETSISSRARTLQGPFRVEYSDLAYHNFLEPIPLTPEWLERMGVKEWLGDNRFRIVQNPDLSYTIYAYRNGISLFIRHLNYVHELQNTFPSLTNSELDIKD